MIPYSPKHLWSTLLATLTYSLGSATPAYAADPADFVVYNYTHGNSSSPSLYGRLFVPNNYDPAQSYPLVLFYHGLGEFGTDNMSQINNNINNLLANAKSRDFFLYAPQHPTKGWTSEGMDRTLRMTAHLLDLYSIDKSRLYITGLSNGSDWSLGAMSDYDGVFAGGVSIAEGAGVGDSSNLVDMPLWLYIAANDGPQKMRGRVNSIRAALGKSPVSFPLNTNPSNPYYNNGEPYYSTNSGDTFYSEDALRYSEYASGGHNIWGRVYNESFMYDWLLSNENELLTIQPNETIRFDFGRIRITDPDSNGLLWNSTNYSLEKTLDAAVVPFALTDAGRRTPVRLEVTKAFGNRDESGSVGTTLYDDEVALDGWRTIKKVTSGDPSASFEIRGLVPDQLYQIEIFTTKDDNDGSYTRTTRYQINSEYIDLDPFMNDDQLPVFPAVSADASGVIEVVVLPTPGSGARYGHINALSITPIILQAGEIEIASNSFEDIGTSATGDDWGYSISPTVVNPAAGAETTLDATLRSWGPTTSINGLTTIWGPQDGSRFFGGSDADYSQVFNGFTRGWTIFDSIDLTGYTDVTVSFYWSAQGNLQELGYYLAGTTDGSVANFTPVTSSSINADQSTCHGTTQLIESTNLSVGGSSGYGQDWIKVSIDIDNTITSLSFALFGNSDSNSRVFGWDNVVLTGTPSP
ncbi:hypothetical protein [Cerasicoccus arenae]|uniref:Uncharacterized protein n=1 Tax=Cerasicoccus arenae TaxID=424488 RepID=A0A8J3DJA0_9BACT|nr:hypothetical protein [Cerasicoccus arenae]MBK1858767.1 hypothetical protein [Cerasicoccus arenae]GHC07344.1 hypothetical protein GCM10007047_25600 [Cerasicoccus arenae]